MKILSLECVPKYTNNDTIHIDYTLTSTTSNLKYKYQFNNYYYYYFASFIESTESVSDGGPLWCCIDMNTLNVIINQRHCALFTVCLGPSNSCWPESARYKTK